LDPNQKDAFIEIIEMLLNDNSTLVLGSVISGFNQICPERLDLIHKHYRKLCRLLIDADEWSQIEILNLLLRYARLNFLDPNKDEGTVPEEALSKQEDFFVPTKQIAASSDFDIDHRLLLNSTNIIASYLVLLNAVTIAEFRPYVLQPYLKSFYLNLDEPPHIRELKLDILAFLASEANVSGLILELKVLARLKRHTDEIKDYVLTNDHGLVLQSIRVLGRIASKLPQVADECLGVLVSLISNKDEEIVAEAVIVTRQLVQLQPEANKKLIRSLAKSLDTISIAPARASILWLVGQYCTLVPEDAPDTFRIAAKSFSNEENTVKLQILTLGIKLTSTFEYEVLKSIYAYVLNLARYDVDYDVRDRARFLKALQSNAQAGLYKFELKDIFLSNKSVPAPISRFSVKPDSSVRNTPEVREAWNRDHIVVSAEKEIRRPGGAVKAKRVVDLDNFLQSDSEDTSSEEEDDEDDEEEEDDDDSENDEGEEESEDESDQESESYDNLEKSAGASL
ncbi:AP-3 complex subunit beta-2, partial [Phlyctochytrium bullatum]